ncbi:FHA domain-containing protein [Limnoglobus roseus]|uniref:FHA domain-containing protein n=1 Tax=Limnoglobus roseus TaxID=2598579 RepID=UPI00143DF9DF|nr:FHA domain-containing protein [Limnoglobus roseus]
MNPTVLARFAAACGAFAPLEIAIEYHDGTIAATGVLQQPFALVGRDPACDIALTTDDVEPQTAFLQVIGGQLFVADLGTKGGLRWRHGRHPFGWMSAGEPVGIGPFTLRLLDHISPHPAPFGPTFHPLVAGPDVPAGLPPVHVQFKTGTADRTRWPVNRVLTLVGSASDCKIHLDGDDVAPRHCYLVHTPDGLWVVDTSGHHGIRVNGERTRLARLGEADELTVGRFVMDITYPRPAADEGLVSFDDVPRTVARATEQDSPTESARRPDELASPIGFGVAVDSDQLVKTEHEMDLSDHWASQEETDPIHHPAATPPPDVNDSGEIADVIIEDSNPPIGVPEPDSVLPTLQQLGGLHARMLAQFQDALVDLPAVFDALPPDRRSAAHATLARLTDATAELAARQAELLRNLADTRLQDRVTQLNEVRESLVRELAGVTTIP